jgi:hypothetical protein
MCRCVCHIFALVKLSKKFEIVLNLMKYIFFFFDALALGSSFSCNGSDSTVIESSFIVLLCLVLWHFIHIFAY